MIITHLILFGFFPGAEATAPTALAYGLCIEAVQVTQPFIEAVESTQPFIETIQVGCD